MITTIESIKKVLASKYNTFNIEEDGQKIKDDPILEFLSKFLKEYSFINGVGWCETNLTKQENNLYVFKGMNFAKRVAMAGRAGECPIISYCATSPKQIKLYSDVVLDPTSIEHNSHVEVLKIRDAEGVSHGISVSVDSIIEQQEIISYVFMSWGDKKVNERTFRDKNFLEIKMLLELAKNFDREKYKHKEVKNA